MKLLIAVAALLAGTQAGAQTIPALCTCTSATPTVCPIGQDCSYDVTVTEASDGTCQVQLPYCSLCVIGDGSSERAVKWSLQKAPSKYFFFAPGGITIVTPGHPADFVDHDVSDDGRTYTWTATKNLSPVARSHSATVGDGTQTCGTPRLNIVNTK